MITDITLTNNIIIQGSDNGTIIGSITIIDDNSEMTHSIALIDSANGIFGLYENDLILSDSSSLNAITYNTIQLTIQATDTDNSTYEKSIEINIIPLQTESIINTLTPVASKVGSYPVITITGKYFTIGGPPSVYINGDEILINSYSDEEITFTLVENLDHGVYTITILNGYEKDNRNLNG